MSDAEARFDPPASEQAPPDPEPQPEPQPRSPWIISGLADVLLFVATPLLVLPVLLLSRMRFSDQAIYTFVASFGATGHHLPGMLRAYGDKALFRRFKFRFTVVPVLLLGVSLPLLFSDLQKGMTVVLLLWGFWHGLMQVYGFLRIYDAKAGITDRRTAKLDWLMCLTWFGAGLIFSDGRVFNMLVVFYQAGGPTVPAAWLEGFRNAWLVLTALVTCAFLNHMFKSSRERGPSLVKLLSMAISFAFWWFTMVMIDNIVIGIAMFEVFHDIQYLAIVWIFNQKRAGSDPGVGGFTRFLFRRSWAMLGVYIGLVAGYGFLSGLRAPEVASADTLSVEKLVNNSLLALVWTSTLLHFYFDGFIWKVRERGMQAGLGIAGGKGASDARPLSDGLVHAAKWSPFVLAVAALGLSQWFLNGQYANPDHKKQREMDWYQNLVQVLPHYSEAHLTLGTRQADAHDNQAARRSFERARKLNPRDARAQYNLGLVLAAGDQFDQAIDCYDKSLELDHRSHETHFAKAAAMLKRVKSRSETTPGGELQSAKTNLDELKQAEHHFRRSLLLNPDFSVANDGLDQLDRLRETISQAAQQARDRLETINGSP